MPFTIAPRLGFDSVRAALWPVLCGAGAVVSVVAGVRTPRATGASRYADNVSSALWIGNLVAVGVLFVILYLSQSAVSVSFMAMIAVILGLAYWVYGTVISLRWFSLFALLWWAAAIGISLATIQSAGAVLAAATLSVHSFPAASSSCARGKAAADEYGRQV